MGSAIANSFAIRCLAAACLVANVAAAAPSDAERRQAQSLFDRARQLLESGAAAEACPLFAESQRLDPGGGTLINLAVCHEKEGRLATAYSEYQEALSLSIREGRKDREGIAKQRIAALEPRLPRVQVELEAAPQAVRFELDGAPLTLLSQTTPTAVDPGEHELTVRAPGHRPHRQSFLASEGEISRLRVPKLEPEPAAAAPDPPRRAEPTPSPVRDAPPSETRLSTASWVIGGAGVAALGASALTGVLALRADSDADDAASRACDPARGFCSDPELAQRARDDSDRARTLAWVSTGTLIAGLGALGVAYLLPRERVELELGAAPDGLRLGLAGRF
jgi:hypothetical protein